MHRRNPFDPARLLDQVDDAEIGDLPHDELGKTDEGCRIVDRHGEELADVGDESDPLPRGLRLCLGLGLRAEELGPLLDEPLPVAEVADRRRFGIICGPTLAFRVDPSRAIHPFLVAFLHQRHPDLAQG